MPVPKCEDTIYACVLFRAAIDSDYRASLSQSPRTVLSDAGANVDSLEFLNSEQLELPLSLPSATDLLDAAIAVARELILNGGDSDGQQFEDFVAQYSPPSST